ncbi:hypothetical protein BG011_000434 [Mortierella polycephala]|uniref:Uncharacterized protein n=1 Tax=Mortierella polycephala TaxID=41804 RepID=A0A9P6Q942_9FUNG|nr:hypothetical protein BG011_000434 [Mortierella polycephala]
MVTSAHNCSRNSSKNYVRTYKRYGASYHFYKEDKRPNYTFNLQDIKGWYAAHDYELPKGSRRGGPTSVELLYHAKTLPGSSHFTIVDIARGNGGHKIFKTPPYHCEL